MFCYNYNFWYTNKISDNGFQNIVWTNLLSGKWCLTKRRGTKLIISFSCISIYYLSDFIDTLDLSYKCFIFIVKKCHWCLCRYLWPDFPCMSQQQVGAFLPWISKRSRLLKAYHFAKNPLQQNKSASSGHKQGRWADKAGGLSEWVYLL